MWPFSTPYPERNLESINNQEFDFIVVGGGTAGCVLASRLSENLTTRVLLIERGPVINSWKSKVPLLAVDYHNMAAPAYKWSSLPLLSSLGAGDKSSETVLPLMSGKALGGTSKINANLYTRSIPAEYEAWSKAGRKGWSWEEVQPYFDKSETTLSHGKSSHRGSLGPWMNRRLDDFRFRGATTATSDAASELGIPYVEEANNPSSPSVCCTRLDLTLDKNGYKHSTFDAFLPADLALDRIGNLAVCTEALVTSIDIQDTPNGPKAVGVFLAYEKPEAMDPASKPFYAYAKREVILCAGAIGSPRTLLLSGVGPSVHLESFKIPVVKDLPGVGTGLQDHIGVPILYTTPKHDSIHILETNIFVLLMELLKFLLWGLGALLSPIPQISIFVRSSLLNEDSKTVTKSPNGKEEFDPRKPENLPDIEIMPLPGNAWDIGDLTGTKTGAMTYLCVALRPESAGSVRLTSLDPREQPACDLGFVRSENDVVILRKAIKLALALGRNVRRQGYPLQSLHVPKSESDEDVDEFIRGNVKTTFHYSSSCRMAPESEVGVVDDMLRVHGVQGLRIADASIFPTIPAAHLQAIVVMIGERCADFLINEYRII